MKRNHSLSLADVRMAGSGQPNRVILHGVEGVGKTADGKGKAKGGHRRVLYTTRTAAFDAKNRHGLPEQIDAGRSAVEAWNNLFGAL